MTIIETECSRCGGEEYELLNPKTGEVLCPYCRNRWIIPALVQKTETEKFLEEQAKQPRVVIDNTSETDRQLMNMMANSMSAASKTTGCLRRFVTIYMIIFAIVFILIASGIIMFLVTWFSA